MRKEFHIMALLAAMPIGAQAADADRHLPRLHLPDDASRPVPLVIIASSSPASRGNVARTVNAVLQAGLAVLEPAAGATPATMAAGPGWTRHPGLDTGRIALLGFGPDAAGWDGRFSMLLRFNLACGGPVEPVLAAVLRPGAALPAEPCAAAAAAWRLTGPGVRTDSTDAEDDLPTDLWADAGPRLAVQPWPGSVAMSAGEVGAFLSRALAGDGP